MIAPDTDDPMTRGPERFDGADSDGDPNEEEHTERAYRDGFSEGVRRVGDVIRDKHPEALLTMARAIVAGKLDP